MDGTKLSIYCWELIYTMLVKGTHALYRLGQKFLDIFSGAQTNSAIIYCDIQKSPKCLYFEHDWYTQMVLSTGGPFRDVTYGL